MDARRTMPAPSGFRFTLAKPPREESIGLLASVPIARREAEIRAEEYYVYLTASPCAHESARWRADQD